jgi:hypothetical protein
MRLPANIPVQRVVRSALITAARKHAPGLLQPRAALRRPVGRPYGYRRPGPGIPRPPYRGPATGGTYVAPSFATPSYVPDASNFGNGGGYAPDYGMGDGYGSATPSYTRSGRWVRRGRKIVLFGV